MIDALALIGLAVFAMASFAAALFLGLGLVETRRKLARVREGLAEFRSGNLAHRIAIPGSGPAADLADEVNDWAAEIRREREQERAREESHRRLISNISHDLRTPMTSIAGYVDALQRGLGDDPEKHLQILGKKAGELTSLVEDLFFMAKLDAGDLVLDQRQVRVDEIARQAVLGFEPELRARSIAVRVDIPDSACSVRGDESAIRRILTNLIANSMKHAEGMTTFGIRVSSGAGGCEVEVSDNGAGFSRQVGELFERGAAAGPAGGSGLGLAIAHDLAQRMNATVRADSEPGIKTSVTIAFPPE